MSMTAPEISIVMCVRNGETYLTDALDSIAAQDCAYRSEMILIDDGSTDKSVRIAELHPCRPRIIRQQALGYPFALNRGISEANGSYLTFIDSDDVWPEGRLTALYEAIAADPAQDGAFGRISNTNACLRPLMTAIPARMLTTGLLRHSLMDRVGLFRTDVRHAANVDWISRAVAAEAKFVALDLVVCLRRIHSENMSVVDVTRGRRDMLRVIRDHHARTRK